MAIIEKSLMTIEKFKELIARDKHKNIYESRNQIEGLCQLGVDLMNFVRENDWELIHKFNKPYFAFYLNGRIVFGINLNGKPKLFVKLRASIFREHSYRFDQMPEYKQYDSVHSWVIFTEQATVSDLKDVLEIAYSWHAQRPTKGE